MIAFGRPCPTCGMTTSFSHAAHGEYVAAVRAQPLGALLAVATAAGFWIAAYVAATGSRIGVLCGNFVRPKVLWWLLGALAAAWVYKLATYTVASAS